MRKSFALAFLPVVMGGFLLAPQALAQPVSFSDRIVISPNARTPGEFPIIFNPLDESFVETTETFPFVWFIGFRPSTPTNPHGSTFDTSVVLLGDDGTISDIVQLQVVALSDPAGAPLGQDWTLSFTSAMDSLAAPAFPPGFFVTTTETGALQDISGLFLNSDGVTRITPLFNVSVQSDAVVPEPATLALLSIGLAVVGFSRRRKSN